MAKKTKFDENLTFFSAQNWVLMRYISLTFNTIQGKLEDEGLKKDLSDLAYDFDLIATQFEAMYRRVGEEIFIIDERQACFCPEVAPGATRVGRRGRVPAKALEHLRRLPGITIEVRLPGELEVEKLKRSK